MPFIPFMLCERLTDPARLQHRRYIAEPKLDGPRAQLHIRQDCVVACYSRRGLDLLRHAGMAWLREITWPVASAVLDGEAVAGDGHEGIQAVFAERDEPGGDRAFIAFNVLELEGRRVLRERPDASPCRSDRPHRGSAPPGVSATRVTKSWASTAVRWTRYIAHTVRGHCHLAEIRMMHASVSLWRG